jgi:hypothetical protein
MTDLPHGLSAEALLNRADVAAALTAVGFKISPATLATKASRGGGPAFRVFGSRPLYRWGDALAWAQGRLTAPVRSTSEPAHPKQATPPAAA